MRRRVSLIATAVLVAACVGSVVVVAQAADRSSERGSGRGGDAARFVGYWMGIDPLDGGDSRRGITRNDDRAFSIIGRDTVFTLCDGTDRAIVVVDRATVAAHALASDDFVITCTNNGSEVRLTYRLELIARNVARETVTRQNGEPVDQIIFHRVSSAMG